MHAILADWKQWKINQFVSDYEEEINRKQLSEIVKIWTDRAEIILNLLLVILYYLYILSIFFLFFH